MDRFLKFLSVLVIIFAVHPAEAAKPLTVVELFTSQGCSSCPPADAYLGDLAKDADVLALSFHVDYWDNLGWPDPFSSAENTQRQRQYAHQMALRYVYTPQMVIQGSLQATGSDRRAIARKIKQAQKLPRVPVNLDVNDKTLKVTLGSSDKPVDADVYMVIYDKEHVTHIKRGENRGKTMTNSNVVRLVKRIGSWNGDAVSLSSSFGNSSSNNGCAILVQARATGAILGATSMALN